MAERQQDPASRRELKRSGHLVCNITLSLIRSNYATEEAVCWHVDVGLEGVPLGIGGTARGVSCASAVFTSAKWRTGARFRVSPPPGERCHWPPKSPYRSLRRQEHAMPLRASPGKP